MGHQCWVAYQPLLREMDAKGLTIRSCSGVREWVGGCVGRRGFACVRVGVFEWTD
jgi:hypothetical protein